MGYTAFDLDGTLAIDTPNRNNDTEIGEPVIPMVELAKKLIAEGEDVRIFSARAWQPVPDMRKLVYNAINQWCIQHIGQALRIMYYKDHDLERFYDDKAVSVQKDTGRILRCEV